MSKIDYEKEWNNLKGVLGLASLAFSVSANTQDNKKKAKCSEYVVGTIQGILKYMKGIENE